MNSARVYVKFFGYQEQAYSPSGIFRLSIFFVIVNGENSFIAAQCGYLSIHCTLKLGMVQHDLF